MHNFKTGTMQFSPIRPQNQNSQYILEFKTCNNIVTVNWLCVMCWNNNWVFLLHFWALARFWSRIEIFGQICWKCTVVRLSHSTKSKITIQRLLLYFFTIECFLLQLLLLLIFGISVSLSQFVYLYACIDCKEIRLH